MGIRSPVLTGAGRLRRIPRGRRQPADPAGGLLQSQRDVRAQLRAGRRHRSAARAGFGDVSAPARCTASSTCSRRASRICPLVGRDRGRLGFLQAPAAGGSRTNSATGASVRYGVGDARAGLARLFGRRRSQAQPARGWRSPAAAAAPACRRARCSTRRPRASSRATTATATKTSPGPIPNPEAFRDASSARVSAHYQRDNCFGRRLQLRARRHLPPLAHGLHPALPHRQAIRAQRADQLHG